MPSLDDLPLSDGSVLRLSATLDTTTDEFSEIEVTVKPLPTVPWWALTYQRMRTARANGEAFSPDVLLCRNDLPLRLRLDREGTSNRCYTEVPIPNSGDLRVLHCPNCGGLI